MRIGLRAKINRKDNIKYVSHLFGDKRRYLQILLNFISNSLKFTDSLGSVTVEVVVNDLQIIAESDEEDND